MSELEPRFSDEEKKTVDRQNADLYAAEKSAHDDVEEASNDYRLTPEDEGGLEAVDMAVDHKVATQGASDAFYSENKDVLHEQALAEDETRDQESSQQ